MLLHRSTNEPCHYCRASDQCFSLDDHRAVPFVFEGRGRAQQTDGFGCPVDYWGSDPPQHQVAGHTRIHIPTSSVEDISLPSLPRLFSARLEGFLRSLRGDPIGIHRWGIPAPSRLSRPGFSPLPAYPRWVPHRFRNVAQRQETPL